MGYPKVMGAGCAGSTSRRLNVNVNQIQFGDKLQGLPPVTGKQRPYKSIRAKEGGNLPDRERIYCINQLGGIGMSNKNSQFAANADGVGPCPNKKTKEAFPVYPDLSNISVGSVIRFSSANWSITLSAMQLSVYWSLLPIPLKKRC